MKNRRDFLKKSLIGLSGAAVMPVKINIQQKNPVAEIPSRQLGKTGISTPLLSMGTSGVTAPGFVRSAYEAGVKLFFSANYYGEGNNEILVGEGLKGLPRNSFVIGTAAIPDGLDTRTGSLSKAFTAAGYMKKAEESLKRFGIEQIDILLLPYSSIKETILHEGVLKTLEQLKKQGKIRFAGIASHGGTIEALNAASSSGVYDVAMIAYNFRTANVDSLNESISNAVKKGMGIVAMKTIAGASGQKSGQAFNTDAALKWVLNNINISSVISGMRSLEELNKNIAMLGNLKISDQEMKELSLASTSNSTGLYCQQCRECVPQCPMNLEIPTIMRSYMYAYGYKNMEHAWHTLNEARVEGNPCSNCGECNIRCRSGFNIREKIADIQRLGNVPLDFVRS
jgi:predicted aldo/keto reductase-like oxidoreductase